MVLFISFFFNLTKKVFILFFYSQRGPLSWGYPIVFFNSEANYKTRRDNAEVNKETIQYEKENILHQLLERRDTVMDFKIRLFLLIFLKLLYGYSFCNFVLLSINTVDIQLNNLDFNEVRSANADSASVVAKDNLNYDLKKAKGHLSRDKKKNRITMGTWSKIDAQLMLVRSKIAQLSAESHDRISDLTKRKNQREDAAEEPRKFIEKTRNLIHLTRQKSKTKFAQFDAEEARLEREIVETKLSLERNKKEIKHLRTISAQKKPIYKRIMADSNRNDQLLKKMQNTYAVKGTILKLISYEPYLH